MRMRDNCRMKVGDCPFLRGPVVHSGYTGQSGPATWWHCKKFKKPLRDIESCELSGNHKKQHSEFIEFQAEQAKEEAMKESPKELIARVRAYQAKIKGPLKRGADGYGAYVADARGEFSVGILPNGRPDIPMASFIVSAYSDLPALADALEEALGKLEKAEKEGIPRGKNPFVDFY